MFLPPEKKGHETVALTVSFSLSSYVVFKSSVYDLSKDNFAVGAKSDLAIDLSLIDCSYSNFAIIKSYSNRNMIQNILQHYQEKNF